MLRFRDYAGALLILAYMASLVLSAWPPEIRPGFLDAPSMATRERLYRWVGITSGQPLFGAEETSDDLRRAFCVKVRGHFAVEPGETSGGGEEEAGHASVLFPADGVCQIDGFRIRLPPMDRAIHRILVWAWTDSRVGTRPSEKSDARLTQIARHFCTRTGPAGATPDEISLIWYWYHENYRDGSIIRRNALQYRFDCEAERVSEQAWSVSDRRFATFWGSEPWE